MHNSRSLPGDDQTQTYIDANPEWLLEDLVTAYSHELQVEVGQAVPQSAHCKCSNYGKSQIVIGHWVSVRDLGTMSPSGVVLIDVLPRPAAPRAPATNVDSQAPFTDNGSQVSTTEASDSNAGTILPPDNDPGSNYCEGCMFEQEYKTSQVLCVGEVGHVPIHTGATGCKLHTPATEKSAAGAMDVASAEEEATIAPVVAAEPTAGENGWSKCRGRGSNCCSRVEMGACGHCRDEPHRVHFHCGGQRFARHNHYNQDTMWTRLDRPDA